MSPDGERGLQMTQRGVTLNSFFNQVIGVCSSVVHVFNAVAMSDNLHASFWKRWSQAVGQGHL